MQNENTQNEIVKPTPSRGFFRRLSRKARLGILGVTLLVAGAMGAAGLNQIVPKSLNRSQRVTDRLAWYVKQGQLNADLHTFASAVKYIVSSDAELPVESVAANPPVAGNLPTPTPKS